MQLYFQHAIIILYQYESLFCKCHSANRSLLIYYTHTPTFRSSLVQIELIIFRPIIIFLQACKKTCDMNVVFSVVLNFVEAACSSSLISRGVATAGSAEFLIGTIQRGISVSSQDQTRDLVRRTCKPPHSGESERSKSEIWARPRRVHQLLSNCGHMLHFPLPTSTTTITPRGCTVVLYHST